MKKYYKYEIKMLLMNILSMVLFILPFVILGLCRYNIRIEYNFSFFIIGIIIYYILHELLHGIGYSFFAKNKKNIKYGIMLEKGVLYAACQEKLSKKGILISLLLPTLILSVIAFPISLFFKLNWLLIFSIMNLSGATADILMMILILRAPNDIEYIDYNNDVGAYLVSEYDMSNLSSIGFKLTEVGLESEKNVDKSIKRFYISKSSCIILLVLLVIFIFKVCLGG